MEESSRTKKSMLNITSNFIIQIMKTVLAFVTRTVFIKVLGEQYLGVNGLLSNILLMLSLTELGVSTAINFSLYKPLAEKDDVKISSLMTFYKKAYRIIGFTVAALGMILFFFLDYLIKDAQAIQNLNIIYLLYLANTVSTYFISYKETLIYADQKSYKLTTINFVFTLLINIGQVIILLVTKNYILYLVTQFIITFLQKLFVNIFITRKYNYINFNSEEKLEQSDLDVLKTNVKSMFFHKIGDYCINGTDNIIISKFIGIAKVGIYSNYLTLINVANTFINLIYVGITASLGNYIVTENTENKVKLFRKLDFIGFIIFGTSSLLFLNLFNPFILVWIGEVYLLPMYLVLIIVLNFYLTGMRLPISTLKSAAGIYRQDRFSPLIQAAINLVISIVLVRYLNLLGILLGTIISSLLVPCWQRPYIVYKYIFKTSVKQYYLQYIKYFIILTISGIITYLITTNIWNVNNIFTIIANFFIVVTVHALIVIIVFRKTDEFRYIVDFTKEFIGKMLNRFKNTR